MRKWCQHFINLNGIRISYNRGSLRNGKTLLFIHGTRDSKDVWDDFLDEYGARYDTISLDLRGHGQSDKPDLPYSYDTWVDDLKLFTEAIGVPTAILAGHSLGGALAMYMAIKYPQIVEGLILFGCTAADHLNFKPDTQGKTHAEIINALLPLFFPRSRKHLHISIVQYIETLITTGWVRNILPHTHKRLNEMLRINMKETVKSVTVPTLLIFGELDGVTPISEGIDLQNRIQNSTLEIIEDCGHFMYLERPMETYSAVNRFLRTSQFERNTYEI